MVHLPGGRQFIERPLADRTGRQKVLFLQVEGELFFGVADELSDRLLPLLRSEVRVVIFRLKRTHSIDSTVLSVIENFTRDLQQRGGHIILCGVRPELMRVIKAYGLLSLIGRENVFEAGIGIFSSAKQAIARARILVGASIDASHLEDDLEDEPLTYEI
ncbi:MAG TPA: sodium-independent anion transporter [Tepidisphaeraceae bacterium]